MVFPSPAISTMANGPADDVNVVTAVVEVHVALPAFVAYDQLQSVLSSRKGSVGVMRTAAEIAGVIAGLLLVLPIAIDVFIALLVAAGLATLGDRRSARWVLKQEFVNLFRRMRGLEPTDQEPPGLERR
jgi:hypothetical protein